MNHKKTLLAGYLKFRRFPLLFLAGALAVGGFLWLSGVASADYDSCYTACVQEYEGARTQECVNNCVALYPGESGVGGSDESTGGGSPGGTGGGSPRTVSNVSLPNFLGPGVNSVGDLLLKIVNFLLQLAIPLAGLMIVWAGFQFVTAQGSDEKLTKAKKNLLWTVVGLAVVFASQAIIGYVTEVLGGGTGQSSALYRIFINLVNQVIYLLFALVTVYFLWGVVEMVRGSGEGDPKAIETGRKHMIWGIIGMAVMAGMWWIIRAIQQLFA